MGAEKWLDIELWDAPQECFNVLRSRGYRIATTHVGMDAVFINPTSYWYSSMLPNICLEMFPPFFSPPTKKKLSFWKLLSCNLDEYC